MKDSNCYECEHHPECPQYDYNVESECICDILTNPKVGANGTNRKKDSENGYGT